MPSWGLQEGSFLHYGRGRGQDSKGCIAQGRLETGEDASAILTCLAWFFHKEVASSAPWKPSAQSLCWEAPTPGQTEERPGERLGPWTPPCPLPVGLCRCTHQVEPCAPQVQAQLNKERARREHTASPWETGGTGGQEPSAPVPAPGLSCPRPTVRG